MNELSEISTDYSTLQVEGFFAIAEDDIEEDFSDIKTRVTGRVISGGMYSCSCDACKKKLYYAELGEQAYGGRTPTSNYLNNLKKLEREKRK